MKFVNVMFNVARYKLYDSFGIFMIKNNINVYIYDILKRYLYCIFLILYSQFSCGICLHRHVRIS